MMVKHTADNQIELELDNFNKLRITETDSGVIQIENITGEDMGLLIEPIGTGVISITPEG